MSANKIPAFKSLIEQMDNALYHAIVLNNKLNEVSAKLFFSLPYST
ncbi:hypothetical protein MuYL_4363 [Mucilaginibacter xinganensis]|uniref:Uncharacterized protein n=1 Tax=Mucilaginibacter xinganensis TaxID=1234841 RepID=A0A223P318_9SPHI|nr:hypothetical protein MuYL_4363 [Mucilaginibacter xinganensis]